MPGDYPLIDYDFPAKCVLFLALLFAVGVGILQESGRIGLLLLGGMSLNFPFYIHFFKYLSINVIIYQSMYLSIYLSTYLPIYLASIPNFCTNPWVFGFQSGQGGVSSHRSLSIWLHAGGAWPKGRRD